MPGLKIHIDTAEAERATRDLKKNLQGVGYSAEETEKEVGKLKRRLLDTRAEQKSKKSLDEISKSVDLTRFEYARLQRQLGDYSGSVKTMVLGQNSAIASFATLGTALTAMGVAAGYTLTKLSADSIAAASALEEVSSKYSVVFEGQTHIVDEWARLLVDSYAMSTREAKQYLSSVQDLLVPMGMQADAAANLSNEIVKLAADLGSFNNMPTQQVIENVQSALVGEYETMKKYGVVINATRVQQEALNMGLANTKNELTAAHKAQAAYKLILESSKAAIGDMDRTSHEYANTTKRLDAEWEDFVATLGNSLIPTATRAKSVLADMLDTATKAISGPSQEEFLKTIADSIEKQIAMFDRLGSESIKKTRQYKALLANLESIRNVQEDTYLDYGKWDDGIEDANDSLNETKNTLSEIRKTTLQIKEIWSDTYDLDSGSNPVQAAIDEMWTARHNEQLLLKQNIDLQNRMAEAIEDTYADMGHHMDGLLDDVEEENTKTVKKIESEWNHVTENIHDVFASELNDMFDEGIDGFEDFGSRIVGVIQGAFAEAFAYDIMRGLGFQVGAGVGLFSGGASGSGLLGNFGASGGGFSPTNLLSGANSMWGAYSGTTSAAAYNLLSQVPGLGFGGAVSSGSLAAGAELGWGAAANAAIGSGTGAGGLAATLSAAAPWLAIGAFALPMISGLFDDDPDPRIGIRDSRFFGARGDDVMPSQYGYTPFVQDLGDKSGIAGTIHNYYEGVFGRIDNLIGGSVSDILSSKNFDFVVDPTGYDTLGDAVAALADSVFEEFSQELVSGLGMGALDLDQSFFESIRADGESLLDTFSRFGTIAGEIDNFVEEFYVQVNTLGNTSQEAFSNLSSIHGIFTAMDATLEQMTSNTVVSNLEALNTTFDSWVDTLTEAGARLEAVNQAEQDRNQILGANISGLSGQNLTAALLAGGDLNSLMNNSLASTVAGFGGQELALMASGINSQIGSAYNSGGLDAVLGLDLADEMAALTDAGQGWVDTIRELTGYEEDLANARKVSTSSIDDLIHDLQGGSLAPVQSLEYFRRAYTSDLTSLSTPGTVDEVNARIQDFTGSARDYLDFAQGTGGYQSIHQAVLSALQTVQVAEVGPQVHVRVKIGEREIEDMTVDVLTNSPEAQAAVERITA